MQIVITNPVFGRNLRYLRRKYCLSRRAMARLLGISIRLLMLVESPFWPKVGIDFPGCSFQRLAKIFALDMNSLLTESLL